MTTVKFEQGNYKEAAEYFLSKINMPTKTYKDLHGSIHTRAFAVAGAMREDILSDFKAAIDTAITKGETLADFRKKYSAIADRWSTNDPGFEAKRTKPGYDAWRSKVIFQTNMSTAYAAGRESQMRDPDMRDIWKYARYCTMEDGNVRSEHAAWNNVVLEMNDPWWSTHTPPNGWGCRCWKEPISQIELEQLGLTPRTLSHTSPEDMSAIDKGWDYNPVDSLEGNRWMDPYYRERDQKFRFKPFEQEGFWENGQEIELKAIDGKQQTPQITKEEFAKNLNKELGSNGDKNFEIKNDTGFTYTYNIKTDYLIKHLPEDRSKFVSMIAETIKEPQEIRAVFKKGANNQIGIRQYFLSKFNDGIDKKGNPKYKYISVVFDADRAKYVGYTTIPMSEKPKAEGTLVYKKKIGS